MRLFYSPGAASLAPHIALREAERSFELERVDLKTLRTASGDDYLAINPKAGVPALELDGPGGEILTEVAPIVQYIADLAPARKLAPPGGTFSRYHLQEWLSFIGTEIYPQLEPLQLPDTPAPVQVRARSRLAERFGYLGGVLVDRAYLMGETFSVADCYLWPVLRWCERYDLDLALWPNLADYFARVLERPAVQTALRVEGLVEARHTRRTA